MAPIDYPHVDAADRSYQEALAFHDSGAEAIQRVLTRIRKTHPEFDCLNLLELGARLAALL